MSKVGKRLHRARKARKILPGLDGRGQHTVRAGIQRAEGQLRDFPVPWGRLRPQASGLHVPIQGGGGQKHTYGRRDGQHLFQRGHV